LAACADFLIQPHGERTILTTGTACTLYAVFYLLLVVWPQSLRRAPA
jgi:hypothetical protein